MVGDAPAVGREPRVALAGGEAAAHGLHLDNQVDQVVDRLVVLGQPHRVAQGQRQTEGELGLGQPPVNVVPDQPADDGLGGLAQ